MPTLSVCLRLISVTLSYRSSAISPVYLSYVAEPVVSECSEARGGHGERLKKTVPT